MSGITKLVQHAVLPPMVRLRQNFPHTEMSEEQVLQSLREQLAAPELMRRVRPGQRICLTAGSRGLDSLTAVLRYLAAWVKERGAEPFVVPAMGSHGGATDEGQRAILTGLGITEESVGCPILSSMETVPIARCGGEEVHLDRNAWQADGIIAVNRVKAHTSFQGPYESGLMKILTIGLGKQHGAYICHAGGDDEMSARIGRMGRAIIDKANVVLGVALLENAYEKTFRIAAMPGPAIPREEPGLLKEAKAAMGKLPFDTCDVLIVQCLGKDYSGAGMDPNVTGRCVNPKLRMGIEAQRVGILDLSDASHGNATGMGRADLAPRRFYEKIDFDQTYPNFVTSYSPRAFLMPIIVDNDREVIQTALASSLGIDRDNPRIVLIRNSLEIEEILISQAMVDEVRPPAEIVGEPFPLAFDPAGNLLTRI